MKTLLWTTLLVLCAVPAGAEPPFVVTARGGVGNYTGGLTRFLKTGPVWGASLGFNASQVWAVELSYEGSSNNIAGFAIPETSGAPALNRNGGSVLVRAAPRWHENVRPFVGAGVAAIYADASQDAPDYFSDDFMEEIPFVTGVDFLSGFITAGVRGSFRLLIDDGFVRTPEGDRPGGGRWDVNATVGGRF